MIGVAAAIVGTGGLALALGGTAIALTGIQLGEDVHNGDAAGVALDIVSLVPGAIAEAGTLRAGFLEAASATKADRGSIMDGVALWNAARRWDWSSKVGKGSALAGLFGGAYGLIELEAQALGLC